MLRILTITTLFVLVITVSLFAQEPPIPIHPRNYVCYKAAQPLTIDGLMNEADWAAAPWTEYFVDIEGSLKPEPRLKTRAKMLWDDQFLYIAAYLEEPHVWATLTERESVIFYDPDFEVFIDPDGDTHHYIEYEMNAFNTQWDLLLLKPYRDDVVQNVAIDHWSMNGMRSAVHVDGTINDASDIDKGWSLEIAIPMDALMELNATGKLPVSGEHYRIGFSRVEWTIDIVDGKYKKRTHIVNGKEKPLPEDNWIWSPQGVIAMHQPETWGYLQFSEKISGQGVDTFIPDPEQELKWALRLLYYRQNALYGKEGSFTTDLANLKLANYLVSGKVFAPEIRITKESFEAVHPSVDGRALWHIQRDGRIWKTTIR